MKHFKMDHLIMIRARILKQSQKTWAKILFGKLEKLALKAKQTMGQPPLLIIRASKYDISPKGFALSSSLWNSWNIAKRANLHSFDFSETTKNINDTPKEHYLASRLHFRQCQSWTKQQKLVENRGVF